MKKSNKKRLLWGLTSGVALLLAACVTGGTEGTNTGEEGASGEKETLEFWSFWGEGSRREFVEEVIEEYNNSQDEVEVEYVYQPWGDIWTKSLAGVAAGNPPDIVVQDINSVRQRADAQQNTNLEEYLASEDISDRFYPHLWDTVIHEDE